MQKPKLNARVRQETQDKLKHDAKKEGQTLSNHVDHVLTKHVSKREYPDGKKKMEYEND